MSVPQILSRLAVDWGTWWRCVCPVWTSVSLLWGCCSATCPSWRGWTWLTAGTWWTRPSPCWQQPGLTHETTSLSSHWQVGVNTEVTLLLTDRSLTWPLLLLRFCNGGDLVSSGVYCICLLCVVVWIDQPYKMWPVQYFSKYQRAVPDVCLCLCPGCSELTDSCLSYLKRLSSLTLLDLRGCKNISRRACNAFISDLSHVALYCMMEEKLIQRLD